MLHLSAVFVLGLALTVSARFGNLIFNEDFNTFDLDTWKHEITASGEGNWEFEFYANNRSNSYVKDGFLFMKPTLTTDMLTQKDALHRETLDLWGNTPASTCTSNMDWGCQRTGSAMNPLNPIMSARIRTAESFSFKYGRIEVRAMMPRGDWIWPAVWMLPRLENYGKWPASGEIDIIESRGNDFLKSGKEELGVTRMGTTMHWGPYFEANQWWRTTNSTAAKAGDSLANGFHTWSLEWTPSGVKASMDGANYFNAPNEGNWWRKGQFEKNFPNSRNPWQYGTDNAPFDKEFYILINVAVGGVSGFFPDDSTSYTIKGASYKKPWGDHTSSAASDFWNARDKWYPTWKPDVDNGESAALKVDYIKVWEYTY